VRASAAAERVVSGRADHDHAVFVGELSVRDRAGFAGHDQVPVETEGAA
jgi:hypothetical protein